MTIEAVWITNELMTNERVNFWTIKPKEKGVKLNLTPYALNLTA